MNRFQIFGVRFAAVTAIAGGAMLASAAFEVEPTVPVAGAEAAVDTARAELKAAIGQSAISGAALGESCADAMSDIFQREGHTNAIEVALSDSGPAVCPRDDRGRVAAATYINQLATTEDIIEQQLLPADRQLTDAQRAVQTRFDVLGRQWKVGVLSGLIALYGLRRLGKNARLDTSRLFPAPDEITGQDDVRELEAMLTEQAPA